jgi:hypothetical protein
MAGSQFPGSYQTEAGQKVLSWGKSEIAGQRPVAMQRPMPADAQGQDREAMLNCG